MRRRPAKRTRFMRKRRIPRGVRNQVHHFMRRNTTSVSYPGAAIYRNSIGMTLDYLPNYTEFTNLYDLFRLNFVVATFRPRFDISAQTPTNAIYPRLYWARDQTDENPPATLAELQQYQRCKMAVITPVKGVTIKFKPNVVDNVYGSTLTTSWSPKFKQWIESAQHQTRHYGVKYVIDMWSSAITNIDIEYKVYFSCKSVR